MLLLETHTIEEINLTVWNPIIDHIRSLLTQNVGCLLCSASRPACFKGNRYHLISFVHLVTSTREVIYLGTVYNAALAINQFERRLALIGRNQEKLKLIKERGWKSVVRERYGLIIPVARQTLDQSTLELAVCRYMQTFAPDLASLPIRWLPQKVQLALDLEIEDISAKISHPMTPEERDRVFLEDSEDFPFLP